MTFSALMPPYGLCLTELSDLYLVVPTKLDMTDENSRKNKLAFESRMIKVFGFPLIFNWCSQDRERTALVSKTIRWKKSLFIVIFSHKMLISYSN